MFFRKSSIEPLPLTMTGVRMGERLLQIGVDSATLSGTLAGKVGLSGTAAQVVSNEDDAKRARDGAAKAGALLDVRVVSTMRSMPFDDDAFDLIVFHSMNGLLAGMSPYTRVRCLEEAFRVLRPGGRLIVIEPEPRGGLGGFFRPYPMDSHYAASGESVGALKAEGFKPVRVIGNREGYRFVEGLKPSSNPEAS